MNAPKKSSKAPAKLHVPPREKLSELTHQQLVALRDALRGQPKTVADKAYRRAVRKLERATRGKNVTPKSAAKKPAAKEEHLKKAA